MEKRAVLTGPRPRRRGRTISAKDAFRREPGEACGNIMALQFQKTTRMIERVLLPLADSVSSWPTLAAIRSALVVTLPLMFLGSCIFR